MTHEPIGRTVTKTQHITVTVKTIFAARSHFVQANPAATQSAISSKLPGSAKNQSIFDK